MRNTRIIQLGDIPSFPFFEAHAQEYRDLGFDGVIMAPLYGASLPIYLDVWSSTVIPWNSIPRLWHALDLPPSYNLAHNYLRSNVTPGSLDWFDSDLSIVQDNLVGLATLARESFCRGIFFDNEPYQGQLWNYQGQPEQGSHTFNEYKDQVRAVATAMGIAMWTVFPSCIFFVAMGYWADVADTGHPDDERQYGLYSAFLDGILDSMEDFPCVQLIIGNEFSYACKAPDNACFEYGVRNSKTNIDYPGITGSSAQFGAHARIAMATNVEQAPFNNVVTAGNYFTPSGLTDTLIMASQYTDKYLWVYTGGYGWLRNAGSGILSIDYRNSILNALPSVV